MRLLPNYSSGDLSIISFRLISFCLVIYNQYKLIKKFFYVILNYIFAEEI